MWSYVGTLGQLLAIAAIVSCQLLEVCKEGCVELSKGRSCRDEHEDFNYPPTATTVVYKNGQHPSCEVCNDCLNPLSISLELNTELLHYNQAEFGIAVTWKTLENVTGFTLILAGNVSSECSIHNQCVSLPRETQRFNFTYWYKHSSPNHQVRPHLYVKLIAVFQNGCSTMERLVTVPRNCHSIHPGDCQLCGVQDFSGVPEARNIAVTPLLGVADSTWEAFVSWETSRPCPLCLFYLTVRQQPSGMEVTPRLKVVGGRTNISLHNLEVQQTYSIQIRPYECTCRLRSTRKDFTFVSATSTVERTASTVEPVTSASLRTETATHLPTHPIPSSHTVMPISSNPLDRTVTPNPLDRTVTPNPLDHTVTPNPLDSSNPLDRTVTSIKVLGSSQQYSPTPSQVVTTNTGQLMALYPAVGVGVALVIAMTIVAGVFVTVILLARRPPRHTTSADSKHELGVGYPDTAAPPAEPLHSSHHDSDSEVVVDIKDISYPSPLTPPPTPPSTPPLDSFKFPDTVPPPLSHTVLLVYSSATPENQQHSILRLMSRLQDPYGITVLCSQMKQDRKRLVEWVPHMSRECSSVVCICNKQFYNEWEGAACNGSPVHFLKEVINGIVSAGESEAKLSKYAVVYTQQRYVPQYLLSCEKHCLQSKIDEKIARFIKQIPEYQLQTQVSSAVTDSSR